MGPLQRVENYDEFLKIDDGLPCCDTDDENCNNVKEQVSAEKIKQKMKTGDTDDDEIPPVRMSIQDART